MGNSCRTKLPHSEKDTAYVKQKEPPSSGSIILQPTGELQLARPNQHVDFEQHVEIRISEESIEDLMGLDALPQRRETKMNTLAKRNLNKIFLNMLE